MKRWMNRAAALAATAAMVLVAACGGGTDKTKAHVRFVDASSGYSTLSMTIGSTSVAAGVAYGGTTNYIDVSPSDTDSSITSTGSATVLSSKTLSLSKDTYYTMLAYGKAGALTSVLLEDNNSSAASGKTYVRIINTAPDAGSLDVYLTGTSDTLAQSTTLQSAVAYGTMGSYNTITSGTWRLRVTATGSKTDVRLDVPSMAFSSTGVTTLVLSPGRGGVLVHALLLNQQSDTTVADNTQARLRVVAGVNGTSAITAKVAGTALMNAVASPTRTDYTLVSAGTQAVAVTSGSASAALASMTLVGGGDYTLLVYGPSGTPVAAAMEDDNTLPTTSSAGKLRLVHGVDGVTGNLALKTNFLLSADSVAPGKASAYFTQAASTTVRFDVSSSDGALSAYSSTGNEILSSGIYTLFMVGSAAAPVGILAPDR